MFEFFKKPKDNPAFLPAEKAKTCKTQHRWHTVKLLFTSKFPKPQEEMTEQEIQEYMKNLPFSQVCLNCGYHVESERVLTPTLVAQVRDLFVQEFVEETHTKTLRKNLRELVEATVYTSRDKYPQIPEQQIRELLQKSFAIQIQAEAMTQREMADVHIKALLESFRVEEEQPNA